MWEAFRECRNLKTIHLPEGLESIGAECFRYTALKEITIPKSVKSIGCWAFPDDTVILRPADYRPEGVLTADMVREQLNGMQNEVFRVPEGTTIIDFACFKNTDVEEVVLPNTVKEIR